MMTREQWEAIEGKDRRADGHFWYAVRGGKTFCKPSCPKKLPRADRVLVFSSCEAALQAGFLPCRLCRPDRAGWKGAKADLAERAMDYLENHMHEKFSLQAMAEALHTEGSYLLRTFHDATGHTPLWFHREIRIREACDLLETTDEPVAGIASATGFSTPALFSRVFAQMRGMPPSEYRRKSRDAADLISQENRSEMMANAAPGVFWTASDNEEIGT